MDGPSSCTCSCKLSRWLCPPACNACGPPPDLLQAEEQALAARRDAAEMSALKHQLHALQLAGGACGSGKENGGAAGGAGPAGPAAADAAAVGTGHHAQAPGGVVLQGRLCDAVQRLLRERELLLGRWVFGWLDG